MFFHWFIIILLTVLISSCESPQLPKPRGFFRIDFPEKKYQMFDTVSCPFWFSYPVYSTVKPVWDKEQFQPVIPGKDTLGEMNPDKSCWRNLEFPQFMATIYFSFHSVNNNLKKFIDDAHGFAYKHSIRADAINEKLVKKDDKKVFGTIFELEGNTASNVQFFLTDSTHYFIRGVLYFNIPPQRDSLDPVVQFIKKDIYYMIESWEWKDK